MASPSPSYCTQAEFQNKPIPYDRHAPSTHLRLVLDGLQSPALKSHHWHKLAIIIHCKTTKYNCTHAALRHALTQHSGMHSRNTHACTHTALRHALKACTHATLRHALMQHSGMHSRNTHACTHATLTHALTQHSCMHSRNTRACTHATLRHASRNCSICRTICITHNKNTHPGPDPGA